jgi:hypothetical protein
MNRNDLRRVDMNLLVIFEALMFEKNLTRVAEKLFMGPTGAECGAGTIARCVRRSVGAAQRSRYGSDVGNG